MGLDGLDQPLMQLRTAWAQFQHVAKHRDAPPLRADTPGWERLAINLTRVKYIDSSGIASLLEVLKEGRTAGKRVMLFGVTGSVLQVLQLTRLTGVFEILENEEKALDA